ncbi:hypothetical protein C2845_PM18G03580 [Panicum miliaceum]|uniref:Cytokinin riboside 5'-monophosphate phosphoribohydrolase n=1 Tax=Panicum miliaceum TaxID=4540 RepID=A0A3L6PIU0_PANMI|nr:hypothetical protein C2845_PM18G03580 [Panicum miliaceum]
MVFVTEVRILYNYTTFFIKKIICSERCQGALTWFTVGAAWGSWGSSQRQSTVACHSSVVTGEIIGEKTVGEVRLVADMHQRKAEMARQSDGFIALPGGYGTMEELLEVMTWAQLGIHRKPIGLLNVDGYYDSLITFIDHAVGEGFISPRARGIFIAASTAQKLMDKLEEYVPYYDCVATGLKWETRITKEAYEDSGNSTASLKPQGRVFNTSEGILSKDA